VPAASRLAWFRWNPRDHQADPAVRAMSPEERGRYRDVLDALYMGNNATATEREVRLWAGYSEDEWAAHREALQRAFQITRGGEWVQRRTELELEAARRRSERASKGGVAKAGRR
jgi:uncharacterized protein YdaU (DUF1376 family)